MNWYKNLSIDQKINLKECCNLIIGLTWKEMSLIFSMPEILDILHRKLQIEGFDV